MYKINFPVHAVSKNIEIFLQNLTIVIPSLGKNILYDNLNQFHDLVKKYAEIIVILPYNIQPNSKYNKFFSNIKFLNIKHDLTGQVSQRIEGFNNATKKYVLQLDDDCFMNIISFFKLFYSLKKNGLNCAVGPIYYDIKSPLNPIHKINNSFLGLFKRFILFILANVPMGSNRMGTISELGTNYGVDPNFLLKENLKVQWLPGGCILHYNKNLILKNYYPFEGKAYCEDLIHSHFLKKNKISLFNVNKTFCYTDMPLFPSDKNEIHKYVISWDFFNSLLQTNKNFKFKLWKFINKFRFIF